MLKKILCSQFVNRLAAGLLLLLATSILLVGCSAFTARSEKYYSLDVQVKCPPETGGKIVPLPEILLV
nr:MAG TPA: outer membrane protein assembly factor [Microviridae sp.]